MNGSPATRPSRLRAWLGALRPATLLAGLNPVLVGCALAHAEGYTDLSIALACLVAALSVQVASNLHNDVADFERGADTEERIGAPRASQQGWIPARHLWMGSFAAIGLGLLAGGHLLSLVGWPVAAIAVASIGGAYAYTGGPFPLAYHGLGDLFVVLFFGVVAVCGTYYVHAGTVTLPVFVISLSMGFLTAAILVVNNLRDRATDEKANKRTLVVRYGDAFGRRQYEGLLLAAFLLPTTLVALSMVPTSWLLCWAAGPLALLQARTLQRAHGEDLNVHLGRTARLGLIFGALLAWGVLA
jgi:1,4-dihydroxy-2-naphthoate octaprenyltransferase